jgi:hypothetical protein
MGSSDIDCLGNLNYIVDLNFPGNGGALGLCVEFTLRTGL